MKNYALYFFFLCSFLLSEPKEHQSLMATLFVQNSAESYTNSLSIYKAAEDQLEKVVENTKVSAAIEQTESFSGKPPAVILDVDQTVLDNIAYQARLIETNTYYPQGWKEWCEEEQADYMPGVESFLNKASELGVEVFFITNRDVNVELATKNNLEKLGFKFTKNLDQLLMKNEKPNWGSNKNSRRSLVAENYRIVMMIGDNLGDFVDGSDNKASAEIRLKAAEKYSEMWGTHWFMLANPTYGDWENTIIDFKYEIPNEVTFKVSGHYFNDGNFYDCSFKSIRTYFD